jgi:hypothetical protein
MRLPHYSARLTTIGISVAIATAMSASAAQADLAGPVTYGDPDDLPIIGDWDGNGNDEIGVYRPSSRTFYHYGTDTGITYGDPGDKPIVGDWNSSGGDDIGVYRPSNRTFYPY